MKKFLYFTLALTICLISSGCRPGGADSAATATQAPAVDNSGEPTVVADPNQTYPGPLNQGSGLYPWFVSGAEIPWNQAVAMIINGEVSQVTQTHDLRVSLTVKDGRTLVSLEPSIDEVMRVIQTCGDACKEIRIATE